MENSNSTTKTIHSPLFQIACNQRDMICLQLLYNSNSILTIFFKKKIKKSTIGYRELTCRKTDPIVSLKKDWMKVVQIL
jgi:hypothetical protein